MTFTCILMLKYLNSPHGLRVIVTNQKESKKNDDNNKQVYSLFVSLFVCLFVPPQGHPARLSPARPEASKAQGQASQT